MNCEVPGFSVGLSLFSAFLFALGIHVSRIGLRYLDSQSGALIQIGAATALYWIFAPFFVEAHYWLSPVIGLLVAIGVFRPFLSANLAMAGTRRLGPTISSTLSSTSPLFGVAFGVLLLGEALTPATVLGTLGIVAGVVVLSWRGDKHRDWVAWALLLPVGAAIIRSLAHVFAKIGLETLPSPFFVGLVGYSASFIVALLNAKRRRQTRSELIVPGAQWFVCTGVIYGASIFSLNYALQCGKLVTVAPIVACAPIFTLLLGAVVFREDALNWRVVLSVALVVPSVVMIAVRG